MEIDRKELKHLARERMKQTQPSFWLVALVFLSLTSLLPAVLDLLPLPTDAITGQLFFSILIALFVAVIRFGYKLWSLWTFRQLDPGMYSLMQGFSVAGRVLLLELGIMARTFGWTMLLSFALTLPLSFAIMALPFFFPLLVTILYVAIWVIQLRYALAHYLLADRPDDGPELAIRRSVELMRDWRWELFKLDFSFLGWELLALLPALAIMFAFLASGGLLQSITAGNWEAMAELVNRVADNSMVIFLTSLAPIPVLLWLEPYRGVTRAGFYDARLRLHRSNHTEAPPV